MGMFAQKGRLDDDHVDCRSPEHTDDLRRPILVVDRNLDGAKLGQGEPQIEVLETILEQDLDAGTLLDLDRGQRIGNLVGATVRFRVSRPARPKANERSLARDGRLLRQDLAGHAFGQRQRVHAGFPAAARLKSQS